MIDLRIVDNGTDIGLELRWIRDRIEPTIVDVVKDHSRELEEAAKTRALNLRMGRGGDRSLRRALAAAIYTRFERQAVSFVLNAARMPRGQQSMPFASIERTFSHPVFGHNVTVTQSGDAGWFAKAIIERAIRVLPKDMARALDRLAKST